MFSKISVESVFQCSSSRKSKSFSWGEDARSNRPSSSTIISQLVYSFGGSGFAGANGSMMIEVVVCSQSCVVGKRIFLFSFTFSALLSYTCIQNHARTRRGECLADREHNDSSIRAIIGAHGLDILPTWLPSSRRRNRFLSEAYIGRLHWRRRSISYPNRVSDLRLKS